MELTGGEEGGGFGGGGEGDGGVGGGGEGGGGLGSGGEGGGGLGGSGEGGGADGGGGLGGEAPTVQIQLVLAENWIGRELQGAPVRPRLTVIEVGGGGSHQQFQSSDDEVQRAEALLRDTVPQGMFRCKISSCAVAGRVILQFASAAAARGQTDTVMFFHVFETRDLAAEAEAHGHDGHVTRRVTRDELIFETDEIFDM